MTDPQTPKRESKGSKGSIPSDPQGTAGEGEASSGEEPSNGTSEPIPSDVPKIDEGAEQIHNQDDEVGDGTRGDEATPASDNTAAQESTRSGEASTDESAPPNESEVPKGNEAGRKATGRSESKPQEPGARRSGALDLEKTFELVRLDQIDGVDEDLLEFSRKHDLLTEIYVDVDRWSLQLQRWAVNSMHMVLWRRRGRLVVLGSGRMLTLAKRVALYDDLLPATIVEAKTLTIKQKLLVLCEEALFRPALYRTGPGHAAAALRLWADLIAAGVQPARDVRQFALAMGLSPATLRQHLTASDKASKPGKPAQPQ